ncbi:type I secretion system permease/ATPase [Pandoraea commovens]|uniref:Type I secretion system permease/ATPase n=1 Tax=Pandoraea commovens TaxID=2508289 RepID=A0ABY5QNL7_9BURK|nr:type I secretion system permease/ATPase [Pandoraea commovens]UVA81398.1 type I secretion system permease/ATPase [Pandoraea commovens]
MPTPCPTSELPPESEIDRSESEANAVFDSGLASLVLVARFHDLSVDAAQISHQYSVDGRPLTKDAILLAATQLGLKAKAVKPTSDRFAHTSLPAIAFANDGTSLVLARCDGVKVLIQDPSQNRPKTLTLAEFSEQTTGELIVFASRASLAGDMAKFDFSWFIPAIVKYRRLLAEVMLVSFVLQLFALATPMFFQVVMDKVLVHRGLSTLDVIAIGLLTVVIFEVVLTALRTYVFSHTSSRIDVELGARLFRHLLNLPLGYFQARRVGDSVARVRELENIRAFLTGNAVTLVLDLVFSVAFLAVMFHYSVTLTWIVVGSLPCYVALTLVFTPPLRSRLNEKFNRGAENQAFLVETISGIQTVKALAVEPQWVRKWDKQLAAYIRSSFRTAMVGTVANSGVSFVSKVVTVATMYVGAKQVIEADMTVGQLIAFNMLAGHVTTPVMRLAQMWTDFQQTGISVQRLGDILNAKTEVSGAKSVLPAIRGAVRFERTTFRYRSDSPEVIKAIDLDIRPGEVIGVVGRSGSGKSTLTKLIQRLHVPESGRVMVDGVDLALIDASSLRRQVGVVLQESVLFNGTVRENIALVTPGAPLSKVMRIASLAGAHEFITELPEGYDTLVGEHGATLSGGQRQRIAIARALMADPRILIFDEATSALDYESERVIQNNMRAICQGRTVLIVAHRLSAVWGANRIVVMERGGIVEIGAHEDLLRNPEGIYTKLHCMQRG